MRLRPGRKPEPPVEEITVDSPLGYGMTQRQSQFLEALLGQVLGKDPSKLSPTLAAQSIGVPVSQSKQWAILQMQARPVRMALHSQLRAQIEAGAATPTRWLAEVAKLALVDPDLRDYYMEDGALRPISEWTPEMSAQVAEIQSEEVWEGRGEERAFVGYMRKVKLHPKAVKVAALEMLAKYHKLIVQTLEITGRDGKDLFPDDQARADERAKATREQMRAMLAPSSLSLSELN